MLMLSRTSALVVLTLALSQLAQAQPGDQGANRKFDLILRSQITIDRPAKEVWPHFLNMEAWMTGHRFRTLEGKPGAEGEVRMVMSQDSQADGYTIKTVRITPFEQYVVKVVAEKGQIFFGFADFSFREAGGKTHLIYDIYVQYTLPPQSDEQLREFAEEQYKTGRLTVAKNNQNLKALVESKH